MALQSSVLQFGSWLALAALLAGCAQQVDGSSASSSEEAADAAGGAGGSEDAEVVVRNGSGEILQVGELGFGEVTRIDPGEPGEQVFRCDWSVDLPDVPISEFYFVTIDGEALPIVSHDEIVQSDGVIGFRLN